MAIAFDAVSRNGDGFASSVTWSHTCTGSNRHLFVFLVIRSGSDKVTGVTYNGSAMTRVDYQNNGGFGTYLYGLVAPAAGANNVVASLTSSSGVDVAGYSSTGVDQTTPITATNYTINGFQNSPASLSLTVGAGGTGVAFAAYNDDTGNALTPASGQTEVAEGGWAGDTIAIGYKDSATSLGWTWSGGATKSMGQMVAALNAAGGGDTTAPTLSSPVGAQTGSTTASGGVTTDEANGTLYAVCTTSGTAPTATQVAAGQDNTGTTAAYATNQAITSTGAKTVAATGLTASTAYYWHFMHRDAASNSSAVSSSASFTTSATATDAPALSSRRGAFGINAFGFRR